MIFSDHLDREVPRWLRPVFALTGALLLAVSPSLWWQATRPEVYALQLATLLLFLAQLVPYGLATPEERDGRLVVGAFFLFGLSLTNHHFMSLMFLPAIVVFFTIVALNRWQQTVRVLLVGALPAVVLGLLPYAHLVLRSLGQPYAVSLGAAPDGRSLFWVISAKAFQQAVTEPVSAPLGERMALVGFMLFENLGVLPLFLALGGLYLLARQAPATGLLLAVSIATVWAVRGWMGFDPQNPDQHGYLSVAVGLCALAAARLGPVVVSSLPARRTVQIGTATVTGCVLLAMVALNLRAAWPTANLRNLRAAEIVAQHQLEPLPPRAVVITENFNTAFNLWAAQQVEGMRPDVAHFHATFLGFPSYVDQVNRRYPELRGVLRAALVQGELPVGEVSNLAQRRPVFVEMMLQPPGDLLPFVIPTGLFWQASGEPLSQTDVAVAIPDHLAAWQWVLDDLAWEEDEQTRRYLVWRLYLDALALTRRRQREAAIQAVGQALALVPGSPELQALAGGLSRPESEGPLDVNEFLPDGAGAETSSEGTEPQRPDVLDF
jgi:hypothetical protein